MKKVLTLCCGILSAAFLCNAADNLADDIANLYIDMNIPDEVAISNRVFKIKCKEHCSSLANKVFHNLGYAADWECIKALEQQKADETFYYNTDTQNAIMYAKHMEFIGTLQNAIVERKEALAYDLAQRISVLNSALAPIGAAGYKELSVLKFAFEMVGPHHARRRPLRTSGGA